MASTERNPSLSDPKSIAAAGERIYEEKYRREFEGKYQGKFVAIDVLSEGAYIAEFPEDALEKAKNASPKGIFHLIRVGSTGAFKVSRSANALPDWIFR